MACAGLSRIRLSPSKNASLGLPGLGMKISRELEVPGIPCAGMTSWFIRFNLNELCSGARDFAARAGLPDGSAGDAKTWRLPAAFFLTVLAGSIPRIPRRLLLGQKLHQLFRLFALFGFGGGLGLFLILALAFFRFAGRTFGGLD